MPATLSRVAKPKKLEYQPELEEGVPVLPAANVDDGGEVRDAGNASKA